MRTELRIIARVATLPEIHASGGLSARRTGPDTVHLIGTAATPLGGDELDITVVVAPGARLVVRSVAATIALPSAATPMSLAHWRFEVGRGGELDFDPEPTIVAGGAQHHTVSTVRLAADARLRLRERVQIGRSGEAHGGWRGDLIADIGKTPLLRHRLELGLGAAADDALDAPRALESELRYPDERPEETVGLTDSRLPLAAGGSLRTRTSPVL
ncbi:urease accessory protein UreD [Nocardia brasiliensis]|uniref:urease accessory protein UreD n=1 Tax=Nocardia brasiliensis TaxID=37326 RepID=UPI0018951B75|nr:urease accessory protein UreD [Nocardia brasiliensis]MBF6126102.1 urease accessory protein UreD [Nocardia brasiliensis]MBF6542889.1 urease accessory protein UreD [Nocardia brasiliensis]